MQSHSYHVLPGVRFAAEVPEEWHVADGAKLVILGARSADEAISEATTLRKLWPDAKIVLLEPDCPVWLDSLFASQIDACVPLFVSGVTLVRILEMIAATDGRILIISDMGVPANRPAQEVHGLSGPSGLKPRQSEAPEATSVPMPLGGGAQPAAQPASRDVSGFSGTAVPRVSHLRMLPELSEREIQILNGLVKGHANKVIARVCDITEATVKVHIRSILRKVRAENRTQAAIWALESGYFVDGPPKSH